MAVSQPIRNEHGRALPEQGADVSDLVWEREIVTRVRVGDQEAFNDLVRRYYAPLCDFVRGMVGPAAAAEIVQELFWKIWKMGAAWEVRSNLASYLFGGAQKLALTQRRRTGLFERWERRVTGFGETPLMGTVGLPADARAEALELRAALWQAIDALSPRCREVAILRFLHEFSCPQIATALGITTTAAERQAAKAAHILRVKLGPLLGR